MCPKAVFRSFPHKGERRLSASSLGFPVAREQKAPRIFKIGTPKENLRPENSFPLSRKQTWVVCAGTWYEKKMCYSDPPEFPHPILNPSCCWRIKETKKLGIVGGNGKGWGRWGGCHQLLLHLITPPLPKTIIVNSGILPFCLWLRKFGLQLVNHCFSSHSFFWGRGKKIPNQKVFVFFLPKVTAQLCGISSLYCSWRSWNKKQTSSMNFRHVPISMLTLFAVRVKRLGNWVLCFFNFNCYKYSWVGFMGWP